MIESPSSQRGRQATEGQNSPARPTALELNGGEGAGPSGWGAALGSGEALGPAHEDGRRVRRLSTDGVVENRGGCGGDGLPKADMARVRMRHRGDLVL
jgi:hypothetical protein